MEEKKQKPKNPHEGHRERMRARVRETGFDGFADHEILEYMLFHVYRRGNTNEIGHALLDRFGSLREVMRASYKELTDVPGVGTACADYILFQRELLKIYERTRFKGVSLLSYEDRCGYFLQQLALEPDENVLVACLDDELRAVHTFVAAKGSPNKVDISCRALVKDVLYSHSSHIIIAHNHPHGPARPSMADVEWTNGTAKLLKCLEIELLDHIIVADGKAVSMAQMGSYSTMW